MKEISICLLVIIFVGCSSTEPYDHYISLNDFHWMDNDKALCTHTKRKNITFKIKHSSLSNIQLKKYSLSIDLGDTVYFGKFEEEIVIRNASICLEDSRNIVWLRIALVDSLKQRVYVWQNKEAYSIDKYNKFTITLRDKSFENSNRNAFKIVLEDK